MIRAAIYMRVSTAQQAQDGDSIPAQRDALHKYIDDHEMVCAGEYLDDGVSGTSEQRDDLQRMLADVAAGQIDLILVTKLDRLYRSIRHYLNLQATLDQYGVNWTAIWEPIYDTTTPQGRLVINQMMSIAQFEAENTAARIKSVFAYKAAQGEVLSGKQPFGYSIVDKHLVPNDDAEIVKKIYEHFDMTGSLCDTERYAATIGLTRWRSNLKTILSNAKYIGHYRDNDAYCPPIIDKALFDRVQRQLGRNVKSSASHTYIFSGLALCPLCGARLSGARYYQYSYMPDGSRVLTGKENGYVCQHKGCRHTKYIERKMEDYIMSNLDDILIDVEIRQRPQMNTARQRTQIEKKLGRLKELYVNGLITLDDYKTDREEYMRQLDALKAPADAPDVEKVKQTLGGSFKAMYATFSPAEKRYLWRSVLKSVTPSRAFPKSHTTVCRLEFL